jgi:hypothetical protein
MAQVKRRLCAGVAKYHDQREPPADAKEFDGKPNKLESYFSPLPGQGD